MNYPGLTQYKYILFRRNNIPMKKTLLYFLNIALLLILLPLPAYADEIPAGCVKLEELVSGPDKNFSIHGEANGFAAFADIICGIRYRNGLCAMELSTFDVTGMVYDYYTGEEIPLSRAFFVVDAPGEKRVAAFAAKALAEKYVSEKNGGHIINYDQLTVYKLN